MLFTVSALLGCTDSALSAQFTTTKKHFEPLFKDGGEVLCKCVLTCKAYALKFKSFQGIYYHMQDHFDPQKTPCKFPGCDEMVKTRRLAWHVKQKHAKPQKCSRCGKEVKLLDRHAKHCKGSAVAVDASDEDDLE